MSNSSRIKLSDVTVCAVDCASPELAARALALSQLGCEFADAVLLSDRWLDGPFRHQKIERIGSRDEYSLFMIKRLNSYIRTRFALVVQWDGYVSDPLAWSHDFFDYDYIGAIWPWYGGENSVGNGGFSLRSKNLLGILEEAEFQIPPNMNEDDFICRMSRPRLEARGIRFAPETVAERFSYELNVPAASTFGFHGLMNMARHTSSGEMIELIKNLNRSSLLSLNGAQLLVRCFNERRLAVLKAAYLRVAELIGEKGVRDFIRPVSVDDAAADLFFSELRKIAASSSEVDSGAVANRGEFESVLAPEFSVASSEALVSRVTNQSEMQRSRLEVGAKQSLRSASGGLAKLNIGCGFNKLSGYINVDSESSCSPDVVADLEQEWPFADNSVTEIQANHVLEHLGRETQVFLRIMKEMYRICVDDARIFIQAPHHNHWTFHADPTHVRKILPEGLKLFDLRLNRQMIVEGHHDTPLAIQCGVDFVLESAEPKFDQPYDSRLRAGAISHYELDFASRHLTNTIVQWNIVLRVRKS